MKTPRPVMQGRINLRVLSLQESAKFELGEGTFHARVVLNHALLSTMVLMWTCFPLRWRSIMLCPENGCIPKHVASRVEVCAMNEANPTYPRGVSTPGSRDISNTSLHGYATTASTDQTPKSPIHQSLPHHLLKDVEGSRDPFPPVLGHVQQGQERQRGQIWSRPPLVHFWDPFLRIICGATSPLPFPRNFSSSCCSCTLQRNLGRLVDNHGIPAVKEARRHKDRLESCRQPRVHTPCIWYGQHTPDGVTIQLELSQPQTTSHGEKTRTRLETQTTDDRRQTRKKR